MKDMEEYDNDEYMMMVCLNNVKNYLWQTDVHISIRREYCMKDMMDGTPIPANIIPFYIHISFPFLRWQIVTLFPARNEDNPLHQVLVCSNITVEGQQSDINGR